MSAQGNTSTANIIQLPHNFLEKNLKTIIIYFHIKQILCMNKTQGYNNKKLFCIARKYKQREKK
jgi:hypothetical protein